MSEWSGRNVKLVDLGYFMEDHSLEVVEWKFKVGRKRRLNATLVCKEAGDESDDTDED